MPRPAPEHRGRLVVVGTGIRTIGQLTVEAIAWLKVADRVLHLVADPVAEELIRAWQGPNGSSLFVHYEVGVPRRAAYDVMVDRLTSEVRAGHVVCAAFYGHPGVFARPSHEAIAALRAEGYAAEMLPGISAEDCLFADLGVDPGDGCLSYEATNFVLFDHVSDASAHLVLWQVGMLGDWTHRPRRDVGSNLRVLVDKLAGYYPRDHVVTVYQAAIRLGQGHRADRVALRDLPDVPMTSGCTLHVPPASSRRTDHVFGPRLQRHR